MPWTKMHLLTWLPTFIVEIIVAIYLTKKLKDKDENTKYLPFKFMAIILSIMEIIKQVVSFANGYSLYHIPLHFCSLFIILLPLHAFYKGKHRNIVNLLTLTCGASLSLVMLIFPSIIYGDGAIRNFFSDYIDGHSVIFHSLVCFYFMLMISLSTFKFNKKKDIKTIFITMTIYSIIAATLAQILETNFNNFYYCGIPFVEDFRLFLIDKIGYIAQIIYILGMYIATAGFNILSYLCANKLVIHANNKEKTQS